MHPFDEMYTMTPFDGSDVRLHYKDYAQWLARQSEQTLRARSAEAEIIFRRVGITFAVYGDKDESGAGTERLIPFDLIPRVIPSHEWERMQAGLVQRVTALNRFIHDVYHDQEIIKAGIVPADQIFQNAQFRPEMMGVDVPHNIYSHISGIDIVRAPNADGVGEYYVLEDNLRVPSGVSYMLEDRKMMMRLFPDLFGQNRVAPVAHYPDLLLETLRAVSPATTAEPTVVVLTPGMFGYSLLRMNQNQGFFNALMDENEYDQIVLTQDWHPANHKSFASNNGRKVGESIILNGVPQFMWPDHCIQGSPGADFHPDVAPTVDKAMAVIRKGYNPAVDSYSGFFENDHRTPTGLAGLLRELGVKQ